MTSTEFKTRLANGDRLAVVMHAMVELAACRPVEEGYLFRHPQWLRDNYEKDAAHILAALASAEAKR